MPFFTAKPCGIVVEMAFTTLNFAAAFSDAYCSALDWSNTAPSIAEVFSALTAAASLGNRTACAPGAFEASQLSDTVPWTTPIRLPLNEFSSLIDEPSIVSMPSDS